MIDPLPVFMLANLIETVRDGLDWEPEHMGYALRAAEELLEMRGRHEDTEAGRWFCRIAAARPVLAFSFDVVPIAKERPRTYHGRRGVRTVTPERTKTAEEHLAWRFRLAMQGREPFAGNLGMVCVFYRPDRRRIDGDNMLKLVCDAGNLARTWGDDCQITTKLARIELDKARPRTEIAIGPMASTLTR